MFVSVFEILYNVCVCVVWCGFWMKRVAMMIVRVDFDLPRPLKRGLVWCSLLVSTLLPFVKLVFRETGSCVLEGPPELFDMF